MDPHEKTKLGEQYSKILISSLTTLNTIIEIPTKAYIDSLHDERERNRRDLGLAFFDKEVDLVKTNQDNDFNDNKLTNFDRVTVIIDPNSDKE